MAFPLRPIRDEDVDQVVDFAVEAWTPVSASMRQVLGPKIYDRLYPDWPEMQADAVRSTCTSEDMRVVVAELVGSVVGFVAFAPDSTSSTGVIDMLAVHPDHQGEEIGTALTKHALDALRTDGMKLAVIETGGDPGHAPARHVYEKAGATQLPIARYFTAL